MKTSVNEAAHALGREMVLHVGPMKTATTYVQAILSRNRNVLSEAGWSYPGRRSNQQHAFYAICGSDIPWVTPRVVRTYEKIGRELVSDMRRGGDSVIASSEALGALTEDGIRRLLGIIGVPTRVVFTLRDLVRVIPSAWQQHLKSGGLESLDDFIADLRRTRQPEAAARGHWQVYAFGEAVVRWANVVGRDRIKLVLVPGREAGADELWGRFAAAAGLPGRYETAIPRDQSNLSLSLEFSEFLRRYNGLLSEQHGSAEARALRHRMVTELLLPVSALGMGNRIQLNPQARDVLREWNAQESEKAMQAAGAVFGEEVDLAC